MPRLVTVGSSLRAVGRRFSRIVKSGSGLDPATSDWLSRVVAAGGTVSPSTVAAVDQFVKDAKAGGWWSMLKRLNLFAGDYIASLVPQANEWGSDIDLLRSPLTAAAYSEATGWVSPGLSNSVIETGYVPGPGALGISAYVNAMPNAYRLPMGVRSADNTQRYFLSTAGGTSPNPGYYTTLGMTIPTAGNGGDATVGGLIHGIRSAVNELRLLQSGVAISSTQTSPVSGAASPGGAITVLGMNIVGGNATAFGAAGQSASVRAYAIDSGMTLEQAAAYSATMQQFQQALNRAL